VKYVVYEGIGGVGILRKKAKLTKNVPEYANTENADKGYNKAVSGLLLPLTLPNFMNFSK